MIDRALGTDLAPVTVNNPLNGSQPYAGALEFVCMMQALKHTKQLVDVLHIEAGPVIPDKHDYFAFALFSSSRSQFRPALFGA